MKLSPLFVTMMVGLASVSYAANDATSSASHKVDGASHATSALKAPASPALDAVSLRRDPKPGKIELTPNHYSFIDASDKGIKYNGHVYDYDTVSGATVNPSRKAAGPQPKPMDLEEKDKILYWTAEPPLGLVEGEYYGIVHPFGHFNDTYDAIVDLVVNDGKIVHVEMDERLSPNYYSPDWKNQKKRRTGYTFFQFSKPRTDVTKVTWANGVTFLEYQILKHNSLNFEFEKVHGSANSARDGFIPAVGELLKKVEKPSGQYYIGYTKTLDNGVLGRIQLVYEGTKLVRADYDEIFPDTKEEIKDPALKKYYRTSKYDSIYYFADTNGSFKAFADSLSKAMLEQNTVNVKFDTQAPEYANFQSLAHDIMPAVEKYLKQGYKHNIGNIAKKPAGWVDKPEFIDRNADIDMALVKSVYDEKTETMMLEVEVSNKSDKPYVVRSGAFYLYALNTKGIYDTVGDPGAGHPYEVAAHGKVVITMHIKPVYTSDRQMSLKYDGPNKVYKSMDVSF